MKKFIPYLFILPLFSSLFFACTKDKVEPDPTVGLTKISEGYALGAAAKVEVYTNTGTVNTGYTKLWFALYDSVTGKRIDEAHIHLSPMMNMGTMQHAAPFENPEDENAVNHLFPASVTFIMPSTAGSWTIGVSVHNHEVDKYGALTIPVTVADPVKTKVKSFTSAADGSTYFVGLVQPATPKVGINDLEFVVYKKASMMSFPADSSMTINFVPDMPSMGHSSPNNVNPVHLANGHYKGKVNFTMTGLWRLTLECKSGSTVANNSQYFEVEF
jgi:hypothetical protein